MDSSMKRMALGMAFFFFAAVIGIVIYANRDSFKRETEKSVSAETDAAQEQGTVSGADGQIGSDTRAFLSDETFFDADKKPYSSIERLDGKNLSLLMTSIQKDLRIQIVDSAGKLVEGENFCVVLNGDKEYQDEDQDGVIYIEYLRAGDYEVTLKEVENYRVPDTPARIEVKQSVEYVAIEDISLLIFTEEDVNPEMEDLEVNAALEDADSSEITKMRESNPGARVGIDVSKWNNEIDWDKVKNAGVEFAVIRVGYRGAASGRLIEDPYFEKNIKGAKRAGIPVGVYFFTQALNVVEAVEEASMVISMCRDYDITYPVFIDSEGAGGGGRADGLDTEARTQVCRAFSETIENAGYRAGIYGARNWFNDRLDMDALKDYIIWLAEYREVPVYQGYYHMWQYTSGGNIEGIEGKVDLNLSYLKIEPPESGDGAEAEETVPEEEELPKDSEIVEPKPIGGAEQADW